jgi:hypothetical protein
MEGAATSGSFGLELGRAASAMGELARKLADVTTERPTERRPHPDNGNAMGSTSGIAGDLRRGNRALHQSRAILQQAGARIKETGEESTSSA